MKLPNLNHIGNWEDEEFRRSIFDSHPSLSLILANDYKKTYKDRGKFAANNRLRQFHQRLNWVMPGLKLTSEDESIKGFCNIKAQSLEDKIKASRKEGFDSLRNMVEKFLKEYDLKLPVKEYKDRDPTPEEYRTAIATACKPEWWRRQVRTKQRRELEQMLREMGQVSANKGGYVSNHGLTSREKQRNRNRESLEIMEAVNQFNEVHSLAELADKTVANPELRRNELIIRARGSEELALEAGLIGVFLTQTAPGAYHCMKKRGKYCSKNKQYNGATPREAQEQMSQVLARVRAKWAREGIRVFGFRIAEPHHDGTPHWHLLLWVAPEDLRNMVRIYRKYVCEELPEELEPRLVSQRVKGGWIRTKYKKPVWLKTAGIQPRFDWKIMRDKDGKSGGAVAYVLKYICKNINGAGMKGQVDKETGGFVQMTVNRVEAWAAIWGIRQFQPIGGATVTVYRELRKVKPEHLDTWQEGLTDDRRLTQKELEDFEALRQAADKADWREYTELQGGAQVRRDFQTLRMWKINTGKPTRTEQKLMELFGVIEEKAGEAIKGVKMFSLEGLRFKNVLSRFYEWTIREKRIAKKGAGTATSWTCVNNCTEPEGGGRWAYG